MSEKNIHEIVSMLGQTDFKSLLFDKDANDSMKIIHRAILDCINTIFPEHEFSVSMNKTHCEPWITKGLRKCTQKQLKII